MPPKGASGQCFEGECNRRCPCRLRRRSSCGNARPWSPLATLIQLQTGAPITHEKDFTAARVVCVMDSNCECLSDSQLGLESSRKTRPVDCAVPPCVLHRGTRKACARRGAKLHLKRHHQRATAPGRLPQPLSHML
jgi:hypothetical protein